MPTWGLDVAGGTTEVRASLLEIRGLVAGYGRGNVLRGTTLRVEEGSITCLIGPNGAGKSTVLKTVSGLLRPKEGTISLRGEPIGALSPQAVLARGVVHVPQERSLFPQMSVWDNVLMGGFILKDRDLLHRRATEVAERFPEPPKGEVTLVLGAGAAVAADSGAALEAMAELVEAGVPRKQAAELVARLTGLARNRLYRGSL